MLIIKISHYFTGEIESVSHFPLESLPLFSLNDKYAKPYPSSKN